MGQAALDKIDATGEFVRCLHSVGAPLEPGEEDVAWPCNDTKYITQFPETKEIWSYGSGYGGNAILAKKCYALRIASVMAKEEGWMAEHMLILKLTDPSDKVYYVAAAFPSACGKTNLAMLTPTIEGWKAEVVGDDIARSPRGRPPYAVNPRTVFGVARAPTRLEPERDEDPGEGHSIFTNVALTDDGDVCGGSRASRITSSTGRATTGPRVRRAVLPPELRYCTPIDPCPVAAPSSTTAGVPLTPSVRGRRSDTVPLVSQAKSWNHATFIGATGFRPDRRVGRGEGRLAAPRSDGHAAFIGYNVATTCSTG